MWVLPGGNEHAFSLVLLLLHGLLANAPEHSKIFTRVLEHSLTCLLSAGDAIGKRLFRDRQAGKEGA